MGSSGHDSRASDHKQVHFCVVDGNSDERLELVGERDTGWFFPTTGKLDIYYAHFWRILTCKNQTSSNLLPDYFTNGPNNNDSSSAAALASVAYRAAAMNPSVFGSNYTDIAGQLRDAVFNGIDDLGVLTPVVDPLNAAAIGTLSTEAQAFGLMMMAAWRDWIGL